MMKNKKVNWGIIGTGSIAHTFADDLQRSENGILYGVASRDHAKAGAFCKKFKALKYFGSYEDLVRDSDIDVVYIATPHTLHYENTMMCLGRDKAVLCEKPLGMNTAEVKKMTEEATSRKLFLMEAMWTRFIPATERLIELLGSGIIGNALFMHADFGFKTAWNPEGRLFNNKLGGGSLMDIGIYPIYLSLLIWGVPNKIKAMARMTETGVDSYCAMIFDHQRSAKAFLESTFEVDTPTEAIIYGEKGSIKLHSNMHHSKKITVIKDGNLKEELEIPFEGHGYIYEIEAVNRCLLNNEKQNIKMPHSMSMDLISVIDRVKDEIGLQYDKD